MAYKRPRLELIERDSALEIYEHEIFDRLYRYEGMLFHITRECGNLLQFASAYTWLGINYDSKRKGWYYREWAPAAQQLWLTGDFNDWNRNSHPLHKLEHGVWEIFLDDATYKNRFKHLSKFKVVVYGQNGINERIPAYATRVVQDEETKDFAAQLWNPDQAYQWKIKDYNTTSVKEPLIYEAHVGMGQEKAGVGTYTEFKENILPRIKKAGYNIVQLMAIQEHPYYGSFGYHVSSMFAPSSRFGTPDELKDLIDTAHGMGLAVIMDIVHSHAVKNFNEGLNNFDGSNGQYFHAGHRGTHELWDSKLFNYRKWEVMQFLLSNVRYWLEEFKFDGFRFDGVTSMLYHHHGLGYSFDHLDKYFSHEVDKDALLYLQLANSVAQMTKPGVISVAEDVSGMPGLGRKVEEGGVGFGYRLGMGIPDFWIKLLKEKKDEDWNVYEIWGVLTNRRYDEKTIAYAESHDQALVGDKTLAFRLMDKDMYDCMSDFCQSDVVDRGIAIHKMIRLITITLGGEGYLNFMGNEFGHPEWIDFPREGNNWSYQYARRQWSLADDGLLKYRYLGAFDRAMIDLVKHYSLLSAFPAQQLNLDSVNNVIIYERNNLIFILNFHPVHSIPDYKFYVPHHGSYKVLLNSDAPEFGGFGRVDAQIRHFTDANSRLSIYIPNRVALVLEKVD